MGILRSVGEMWGEKCGREAAESTPAIMSPQNDDERREASRQQCGYGMDGEGEFEAGFDKGYCDGIRKARARQ